MPFSPLSDTVHIIDMGYNSTEATFDGTWVDPLKYKVLFVYAAPKEILISSILYQTSPGYLLCQRD